MGYELGADDYMTKPFKGKILVAKAKRVMDRVYSEEGKNTLIFEGINIDLDSRLIKIDSKIIEFAPKEFELLIYLAQNQGIIKTREQILNKIWGYDYFGDDRVVDNHIKKVRKKLKGYAQYIKTVITVGYKFEV